MRDTKLFSTWQWLTIVGGLLTVAMGGLVWAFDTFATKESVLEIKSQLNRIEDKIDRRNEREN